MRSIILIAHDIRSCHNVGSLLRTTEGLGVVKVYLTGYTPYPVAPNDTRLPHISAKLTKDIHKTALGAEAIIPWVHADDVNRIIADLKHDGYTIAALEQDSASTPLHLYAPPEKIAILIGREVEGVDPELLRSCDVLLEIPMFGQKESFNVVQATAMVLHHCRFSPA